MNEQVIFGKASSEVKCIACETVISEPSGGKSRIKGKIVEILN